MRRAHNAGAQHAPRFDKPVYGRPSKCAHATHASLIGISKLLIYAVINTIICVFCEFIPLDNLGIRNVRKHSKLQIVDWKQKKKSRVQNAYARNIASAGLTGSH